MYVLDTSIVIKWFVDEENSNLAEELLEKYETENLIITAPDLLLYEFVNVLHFNNSFNSKEKISCIQNLYNLDIYFITPYQKLMENSRLLAETYSISVYDATFIALAHEFNCDFITADEKLCNKVKELKFVRLLKNYG